MEGWQLKQRQSLPLEAKVEMSKRRILEWYEHCDGQVYVSFSGGKDSTVLLHLVRSIYPEVPAVFVDTGLEYPEIRSFVKSIDNVVWMRPAIQFQKVIEQYGYPVVSKRISQYIKEIQHPTEKNAATVRWRLTGIGSDGRYLSCAKISDKWLFLREAPFKISDHCCAVMKKQPLGKYTKETGRFPYIGTMASEGANRELDYLRRGCNVFDGKRPASRPLSLWMEDDIWEYLRQFNVPYSKIYDMGEKRTGCMFCAFGAHLEPEPNRFQRMAITHPTHYWYCMETLGMAKVLDYIGVSRHIQSSLFDADEVRKCQTGS